jgi:hypothetical protein
MESSLPDEEWIIGKDFNMVDRRVIGEEELVQRSKRGLSARILFSILIITEEERVRLWWMVYFVQLHTRLCRVQARLD